MLQIKQTPVAIHLKYTSEKNKLPRHKQLIFGAIFDNNHTALL